MPFGAFRRELDWRLQNALTASLPVIKRTAVTIERVSRGFSAPQHRRFLYLAARYPVASWADHCTPKEIVFNLYVLDLLDRHLPRPLMPGRGLDVGASHWSYLPALVAATTCAWDGVEIDAHRRYWTLTTRRAHADYMCRRHPGCRYIPGSLLDIDGTYPVITWLLPFVTPGALRAGRLPARYFQPGALLRHAWSRLAPGGVMLIVNQGEREATEQQRLFAEQSIPARATGQIHSEFDVFTRPRFGWVVTHDKPGEDETDRDQRAPPKTVL